MRDFLRWQFWAAEAGGITAAFAFAWLLKIGPFRGSRR